jgi:hypothetical protein
VVQTITAELAIPYWGWLFAIPFRRQLAQLTPAAGRPAPWWAPPDRLDTEAAVTLAALALLAAVLGYATILLSQTITFAADEFHAGTTAQGVALAAVRFDVLLSFPLVALTDRRGRRRLLLVAAAAASVVTALGALAPSLPALIVTQVPARGLLTASAVIVTIMLAEEMPAGARAYAVSIVAMAGALGGGLCVLLLPLADIGHGAPIGPEWALDHRIGAWPIRSLQDEAFARYEHEWEGVGVHRRLGHDPHGSNHRDREASGGARRCSWDNGSCGDPATRRDRSDPPGPSGRRR